MRTEAPRVVRPASSGGSTLLLATAFASGVLLTAGIAYVIMKRRHFIQLTERLRSLIAETGSAAEIAMTLKAAAAAGVWQPSPDEVANLSCQPALCDALVSLLEERRAGRVAFDINAGVSGGAAALIAACAVGNSRAVTALIAAGADPHVEGASGLSAAHVAAQYGHLACLKQLARLGGFEKHPAGAFALFSAARASDGATPLMLAAAENQVRCALKARRWGGAPALRLAAYSSFPVQLDVCLWLCSLRVGVDAAMTPSGVTALMAAAQRDHVGVVAALIEAGATLELAASDSRTALAIAAQYNALESALELLKRGANPNGACFSGSAAASGPSEHSGSERSEDPAARATPARQHQHLSETPIGRAAGVSAEVDDPGNPDLPTTAAAEISLTKSTTSRLSHAAPTLHNSGGAQRTGDSSSSILAPTVAPAADNASPVVLAARRGHVEMLRVLVRGGADVNPRLADGRPLLLAAIDGFAGTPGAAAPPARGGQRCIVRPEVVAALLGLGANPLEGVEGPEAPDSEAASVASFRRLRTPASELSGTTDRGLQRVWDEHRASRGVLYATEQQPVEGAATLAAS